MRRTSETNAEGILLGNHCNQNTAGAQSAMMMMMMMIKKRTTQYTHFSDVWTYTRCSWTTATHLPHKHIYIYNCIYMSSLVVWWLACLPLAQSFAVSNPAEGDGFVRAIKIHSTPTLGGEVKPSATCKILQHDKDLCGVWQIYYVGKIKGYFSPTAWFATRCLCCIQRALVDGSGMIITQMGTHNRSENSRSAWDALYDTIPW
jgi:hypothetical protein